MKNDISASCSIRDTDTGAASVSRKAASRLSHTTNS